MVGVPGDQILIYLNRYSSAGIREVVVYNILCFRDDQVGVKRLRCQVRRELGVKVRVSFRPLILCFG